MARSPDSSRPGLRGSIAFRLAVGYGVLLAASMATLSAIVYFGTVGVFEHSIDNKIMTVETHLADAWVRDGRTGLVREIDAQLHDLIDTDTEVVSLVDARGRILAGNMGRWYGDLPAAGELAFGQMERGGTPVSVRLIATRLEDGSRLIVGRDLIELDAIRSVVERALLVSGAVSILLAFFGAQIFRTRLEARIVRIRRTTARIAAGELSSRIVVMGNDEFARLGDDINRMLDRIEALMEGVRHVSNSIAHDLRTPLSRVRSRLDRALQASADPHALVADARLAIEDIDSVISLFDKLLQIAALESGVRAGTFEKLDLAAIAHDMTELYEAAAEEQGIALHFTGTPTTIRGDRDLLASALASLIDNAIKYGRNGGRVDVEVATVDGAPALTVRDYGQGVPPEDMDKITRRFYRVDQSRHLPGNGLGLSIVTAITQLHEGTLALRRLEPGFEASMVFPRA
ncbi:HAMP domain-containing histidine kinase [Telluria mixta]|uniref:histidine kinase n=1 Tax=Telluria mixta TaxID=34071 RepID=A0ABT2C5J6_9BURK|nr:HAMP domain-containing sensor histidine kinase [Telluria mixta]MCS0632660.1 HAMP domain-containing histidine kinase [Telluria mixta]WEM99045.1 HAMP domain-containing sensor histidine kinase [Telluria mixta]